MLVLNLKIMSTLLTKLFEYKTYLFYKYSRIHVYKICITTIIHYFRTPGQRLQLTRSETPLHYLHFFSRIGLEDHIFSLDCCSPPLVLLFLFVMRSFLITGSYSARCMMHRLYSLYSLIASPRCLNSIGASCVWLPLELRFHLQFFSEILHTLPNSILLYLYKV